MIIAIKKIINGSTKKERLACHMGEEEGTSDPGGINLSLWGKGTQAGVKSQVKGFRSMWSSPGGTAGSLESPEGAGSGRVLVRETLAAHVMHRAFSVMRHNLDYILSALGESFKCCHQLESQN